MAGSIRVAQYNAALSRAGAGVLIGDLAEGDEQIDGVVAVIAAVQPDVLLLNEIDRDPGGEAVAALIARLAAAGVDLPHHVQPISNTGRPSGHDIDGDGEALGPADAWGYGTFPGQYAMAVLSRYPLSDLRTWRLFPWSAMPAANRPRQPDGTPLHSEATWAALRLSSKTHLAVTAETPAGPMVLVAAHPTPPVFDGPADRNGRRNADEIRLLQAILEGPDWLVDDEGAPGGVEEAAYVVAGDLNADPADGDARREGLMMLLEGALVQDPAPRSDGGSAAATAQGGANLSHQGDPALDTSDWRDEPGPGNLRVDYVLPAPDLTVTGAGVYWPAPGEPGARAAAASDHRLVWVDVTLP
ncbi:MAG: endonuclease/exonuclease/phosphatase family protein [Pseudomonadota bacterium]